MTLHGDAADAFDYIVLSVVLLRLRQLLPSRGSASRPSPIVRPARALPAGRHDRRIRGTPFTWSRFPDITTTITHLREVLGDDAHESFARTGAHMTTAGIVTYAFDQIDQAALT